MDSALDVGQTAGESPATVGGKIYKEEVMNSVIVCQNCGKENEVQKLRLPGEEEKDLCLYCYKDEIFSFRKKKEEEEEEKERTRLKDRCFFCKKKKKPEDVVQYPSATNLIGSRKKFCLECLRKICCECEEALTGDELHNIRPIGRGGRLCLKCYRRLLKEEMKLVIKSFKKEIAFQVCTSCGRINDSRDKEGRVMSHLCIACRQLRSDMRKVVAQRPSKRSLEKRDKFFDRYGEGFTRKK